MKTAYSNVANILTRPRRVPIRVVVITALASYLLQIGSIVQGHPLYLIALFTLLPWIPLFAVEGIWKIRHYGWIAVFFIVVIMQIGHLGEHVSQVAQLSAFDGTLACPPTVDNDFHRDLAVQNGLRDAGDEPSYASASWVIRPDKATGLPAVDATGETIRGPAACGIFGQLDLEIVHLIWEGLGWFATLALLTKYRRNVWLWISLFAVSLHSVEHLFISWNFFIDNPEVYDGARQLWATTAEGSIVTAHPVGKEPALVSFYEAGGKAGVMAKGGLVDTLVPGVGQFLPQRAWLHFWYNSLVFIPLMAAFIVEVKSVVNEYLASALPSMTEDELASATTKLDTRSYESGEVVFALGDPPDALYILTKGRAEVRKPNAAGEDRVVDYIETGQTFGEMGLMNGEPRTATIRAQTHIEVLVLSRNDFSDMIDDSERSRSDIERIIEERRRFAETYANQ